MLQAAIASRRGRAPSGATAELAAASPARRVRCSRWRRAVSRRRESPLTPRSRTRRTGPRSRLAPDSPAPLSLVDIGPACSTTRW